MPTRTRATCVSCGARLTMGDDETTCAACPLWVADAPRRSMLARFRRLLRRVLGVR